MIAPLLLVARAALAQDIQCDTPMVGPSSSYAFLVEGYRGYGREAAVAEVVSPDGFPAEIAALGELLWYHARHPSCPLRPELEPLTKEPALTLQAAVLLHTDRAFHLLERQDHRAWVELSLAPRLLALLKRLPRQAFEPRWARAAALELSRHGEWDGALGVLERAVKLYPDDPLLLLARGAVFESTWRLHLDPKVDDAPAGGSWQRRSGRLVTQRSGPGLLQRADRDYRQALALRKDLPYARVRLGRVLQLMGRTEDSLRELQAVSASDPALLKTRELYLTRLFLGYAHEQAGDMDRAAAEYEGALRAVPDGQAAAVALSHALHRDGRWPAAREALQSAVVHAGRRPAWDPWWPYVAGQTEDPFALFKELRAEVAR